MTSPAVTFSFDNASIILFPRSYIVSMSVVLMVSFPVFVACMHYAEYVARRLKSQRAYPRQTTVNLDLDYLSLDDLCLLLDAHTNAPAKSLC